MTKRVRIQRGVVRRVAICAMASIAFFSGPAAAVGVGAVGVAGVGLFAHVPSVHAAGLVPDPTGKCPEDYAKPGSPPSPQCSGGATTRDYSLNDVQSLVVRIANWLLGITGSLALFLFVLGAFMWILSAGNSKLVEKGKEIIKAAVIGLIIVFVAYTAVAYGVKLIAGDEGAQYLPNAKAPGTSKTGTTSKGTFQNKENLPLGDGDGQACGTLNGQCKSEDQCNTGYSIDGACGTGTCCMDESSPEGSTPCARIGGVCQSTSTKCAGLYVKNLCPGSTSSQCCITS